MAETREDDTKQPGAVIAPGGAVQPAEPQSQATGVSTDEQTIASTAGSEADGDDHASQTNGQSIDWTASEFIAHDKSSGWYARLGGIGLVLAVAIYVVTRDLISTMVVIVGAFAFGYYAGRQPRQLDYRLDEYGLSVGEKSYAYEEFRSFAVVPEGAFSSIIFMPLKRFATLTTIYYAPEDEDKIIQMLLPRLPLEEYRHDYVDRFMHRIRF